MHFWCIVFAIYCNLLLPYVQTILSLMSYKQTAAQSMSLYAEI